MQTLKKLLPFLCFAALATPAHAIQQLIKSGAAEPIPIFVVDSTGAPVVGVGAAFTVTVRKPGASAYVAASGTVAEDGNGVYDYTPSAAETTISASKNVLLVHAVVTAAATSFGDASAQIVAFDPTTDLGAAVLAIINTQTSSTVRQADVTASLTGTPFITLPGTATTSGTGMVLTYKQVQALIDSVSGGDNVTSGPPVASGSATVTYYLRGQAHSASTITEIATVNYDANKQQVSRTVKIAQPFPAIS